MLYAWRIFEFHWRYDGANPNYDDTYSWTQHFLTIYEGNQVLVLRVFRKHVAVSIDNLSARCRQVYLSILLSVLFD